MNVNNLTDLYTDYLLVAPQQVTATGLSAMVDNTISHDKITRLLSSGQLDSRALWLNVKPMCYEIRSNDGVLIFDDSIVEKAYTDRNELVCWHYDHSKGRTVKGVNFMTAFYHSQDMSLPVAIEFVKKNRAVINKKGRLAYKSSKGKNEIYRELLWQSHYNIEFKYVLNDSWFSSAKNMDFVVNQCKSNFIMAIKENRKVALSVADKQQGKYESIKLLELEGRTQVVYFKQLDFPVLITKQVFKNEDGSTGALYSRFERDDLNLSYEQVTTIYKKRWKVEEYHDSIKYNAAMGKSPTQTVRTQTSHLVASAMAFVKFERLKVRHETNHNALKTKILLKATQVAYQELLKLWTPYLPDFVNGLRKVSYYNKKTGQEIDFILDEKIAVEVKETATSSDLSILKARAAAIGMKKYFLVGQKYTNPKFSDFVWGGNLY